MRIGKEQLIITNTPLVGFGGIRVHPLGVVTLPVTVRDYPQQITKDVTFLVVDCSSAYNAILGCPTLNSWKAVTSTYHLMIKFPTKYGVEVKRDQVAAHKFYITMLEMDDHLQTICIEEQRTVAELVEGLEEVLINDYKLGRTMRIGTLASPLVRQVLKKFLRGDLLTWSHEDMLEINLSIIVHKLNVSPTFSPVRQKKRVFTQKQDKAITKEVYKLLKAGFI